MKTQAGKQAGRYTGTKAYRQTEHAKIKTHADKHKDRQANKKADRYTNKIFWQQDKHAKLYAFRTKHIKG